MEFTKHFLAILLILASSILQAQHMERSTLFSPEAAEDHSGLAFLKPALENNRRVMLGEMTHLYGNIFEMKARVVEFLHQELGITTIAMEAAMYDLWLMTKENPDFEPEEFNEAIFAVWSENEEFQRLVNYIDEHELI